MAGTYFDFPNTPITNDITLKAKWCCGSSEPVYEPKTDYFMLTFSNGERACVNGQYEFDSVWKSSTSSDYAYMYPVAEDGTVGTSTKRYTLSNAVRMDFGDKLTYIPDNAAYSSQAIFGGIQSRKVEVGMLPPSVTKIGRHFLDVPNAHLAGESGLVFDSGPLWIPDTVTEIGNYFLWACNWATYTGVRLDAPFSVMKKDTSTDPNFVYDISSNTSTRMLVPGIDVSGSRAQDWANNLPTIPGIPFRKLNVVA